MQIHDVKYSPHTESVFTAKGALDESVILLERACLHLPQRKTEISLRK
jgi:hypothetical protein